VDILVNLLRLFIST